MDHSKQERESVKVEQVLDDWFNAMTKKDFDGIYKPISNGFIQHLPGRAPIVGLSGFKGIIGEYMPIFGPVQWVESKITVSDSGDLAYEVGRHDHVVYEKSGGSSMSRDYHIIVLKKVDGIWMIDGISETPL